MRKALVVLALTGLSACSGGSGQSTSPAPPATQASTQDTTAAQPAPEDQSDYYAATSCKIYDDIAARLRSGAKPDEAAAEASAATGSAGDAADLDGEKWADLKTYLDIWVDDAIPEPAKRSEVEKAVNEQCAKVPASLRSAAALLPSS